MSREATRKTVSSTSLPPTETWVRAWLGFGSNLGDRCGTIVAALSAISANRSVRLMSISHLWETEPVGYLDQPEFLNGAAGITTTLSAPELLALLRHVERDLGRAKRAKWREREIDIDILLYGTDIINNDVLTIPHPELQNRPFVLAPLREIAPNERHPVLQKTIEELAASLSEPQGIERTDLIDPAILLEELTAGEGSHALY